MKRLAIWNGESLLGTEIKNRLAKRRDLWDELRLIAPSEEDAGTVTEVAGQAAFVLPSTAESFEGVGVLFVCLADRERPKLPIDAAETTVIVMDENRPSSELDAYVYGINSDLVSAGTILASPPPAVVGLCYLLAPLAELGVASVSATVLQSSSSRGQAGVDELLEQARSILAFRGEAPHEIFGHQLAFNVLPSEISSSALAATAAGILGLPAEALGLHTVVGGLFHGLSFHVHLELTAESTVETVQEALGSGHFSELRVDEPFLGPIDAAGSDRLLIGAVESSNSSDRRRYWIRGVMDNLVLGGAINAIGLAEAVLGAEN